MKIKEITLSLIIGIALIGSQFSAAAASMPAEPPPPDAATTQAIQDAVDQALVASALEIPALQMYQWGVDSIHPALDGQSAAVWLAPIDPETGDLLATEPAVLVAQRGAEGAWEVIFPGDTRWVSAMQTLPEDLRSDTALSTVLEDLPDEQVAAAEASSSAAIGGFLLPWRGGLTKTLVGSISHFLGYHSCDEAHCRYAYDFADGTMFELRASRGGTVKGWRDTCSNGATDCTNYIAIEDRSTATIQIYLHLAYDSIPDALKSSGTSVMQGQFIGNVDDTGYSTGHHLHFMVVPTSSAYNFNYWWGYSTNIKFNEISINGGQPRTCAEARDWPQYGTECQDRYTSQNWGTNPPTGAITTPSADTTLTDSSLSVAGYGTDSSGVATISLAVNFDGTWREIEGSQQSSANYNGTVDVCSAGIPNGPFSLGLYIWDNEGNRTPTPVGVRNLVNNAECTPPPPACKPSSTQVAIYELPGYQGVCQTFGIGSFEKTDLPAALQQGFQSIQVGSSVTAVVYDHDSFGRRRQSYTADNANLADDLLGSFSFDGNGRSLKVVDRSTALSGITLSTPFTTSGVTLKTTDSITLDWSGGDGATKFSSLLTYPDGTTTKSLSSQNNTMWSIGSLSQPGTYTWSVTGTNPWSKTVSANTTFTVEAATLPAASAAFPFSDSMEAGAGSWITTGLWRLTPVTMNGETSTAWAYNYQREANWVTYANPTIGAGSLTSPSIILPAGSSYLRFRYTYQTEDTNPYWDQRRVQISVNGGEFTDLMQFSGDRQEVWLNSPAIDLSAYAGKTVRLRWNFDIVEPNNNGEWGWAVDDISVTANAPDLSCKDSSSNDTYSTASTISIGSSANGALCPAGDTDMYKFSGTAGQTVTAKLLRNGSQLNGVLELLAPDGVSVLASDRADSAGDPDPVLAYWLRESGTYYLRVRAALHPGVGGADYGYSLALNEDPHNISIESIYPHSSWVKPGTINLTVNASTDNSNGLSGVSFYYHNSDWTSGTWKLLGTDTNGGDGYQWSVDPTSLGGVANGAFYAGAFIATGQTRGVATWNIATDGTAPVSAPNGLPAETGSTAVQLGWTASDAVGEIDYFNVQMQINGADWQNLLVEAPAAQRSIYVLGQPGDTLGFRMQAVDKAGNVQAMPGSAQTSTTIASTCAADEYDLVGDNSADTPQPLSLGAPQVHNFCMLDEDWLSFDLEVGKNYYLTFSPLGGGAAARLELVNSLGSVVKSADSSDLGRVLIVKVTPEESGVYRLRLRPLLNGLYGSEVSYQVMVSEEVHTFLPLINK